MRTSFRDTTTNSHLFKSIVLMVTLVAITTISHLLPSSGVLMVGLVVVMAIELTRLRHPNNTVMKTLIILSAMTLLWGWYAPHFQSIAHPVATLMFFFWGLYCLGATPSTKYKTGCASTLTIMGIATFVTVQNSYQLISPLLFGYDNSAHVPALSQVYRHGGFMYAGDFPPYFTFSNYANGYPPLQQGTWAFILSIANIRMDGGYEVLGYFSFFFYGTGLLAIALIVTNWIKASFFEDKHLMKIGLMVMIAILIAFSQIGNIFWMGFPSFLWTSCIVLAVVKLIDDESNHSHRVLLGLFGLTLVNYSYPLLSPVLLLVILLELAKMSRSDLIYCWTKRNIVVAIGILISALNVAVVLKSLHVRHYLNDAGGIRPIDLRSLLAIFVVVLIMIFISRYSLKTLPLIVIAFLASTLNFSALAILSQNDLGYVSYYPTKAGYLALILGFASMGNMLGVLPRFNNLIIIKFSRVIATVLVIFVICFSVGTTSNPLYAKQGYTSTQMVLGELIHNPKNPSRDCFLHAMDITSDLNSNSSKVTILYLQNDILTRWINGIRGRLTEATYGLSIPVGQGIQTLPEILKGWFSQYPHARLMILAPEPHTGLEQWSDRIEYRKFACV